MILIGVGSGFYFIAIIGGFFILAAIAPSQRRRPTVSTSRAPPEPRRAVAPFPQVPQSAPAEPMPASFIPSPAAPTPAYTAALFPTSMFPSLGQGVQGPKPQAAAPAAEHKEKDELLEVGAFLAILRIVLG